MPSRLSAARVAAPGIFVPLLAALLAGCSDVFGDSPPHAAPANPSAEGGDGFIELNWSAVTDATGYIIFWGDDTVTGLPNRINDITTTAYTHSGLTNLRSYRYRIAAVTKGGRGPESIQVSAEPGPVPGPVEWVAVTSQAPGHTIYFGTATQATGYRVYVATSEEALAGRRPNAVFEEASGSPHVRANIPISGAAFYRVIAMNQSRIGTGGPVAISPTQIVSAFDLQKAGAALGDPNADGCLDLPTGSGNITGTACLGSFTARVLADVGLGDLLAAGRTSGDSRFADLNGDRRDDLFSNTLSAAGNPASVALLHVNQGTGSYQSSAAVSGLGIGGFGGTVLAADVDNDGDVDLFAPHDHTQGDGARNWLLRNSGTAAFTDVAAAAGVDTNPAGAAYVPRGGQAVDFDSDGDVDLLFGSRLLLNDGSGVFTDGSAAAAVPVRADQGLRLFDVDLDGDFDLIHHDGAVTRLHRNAGGVFDGGTIVHEDATQATFGHGLAVCDVNGDGFEDVVVASNVTASGTGVPVLLINVAGQLLRSALPRGLAQPDDLVAHNDLLACGDVDGNFVADILARWGPSYRLLESVQTKSRRMRIRVLGAGGERNQQGRVVRIVPVGQPNRIMTRAIESGSGLRAQGPYDLLVGAPWPGDYTITVRFAAGTVTATAEAGDSLTIYSDGRVVDGLQ